MTHFLERLARSANRSGGATGSAGEIVPRKLSRFEPPQGGPEPVADVVPSPTVEGELAREPDRERDPAPVVPEAPDVGVSPEVAVSEISRAGTPKSVDHTWTPPPPRASPPRASPRVDTVGPPPTSMAEARPPAATDPEFRGGERAEELPRASDSVQRSGSRTPSEPTPVLPRSVVDASELDSSRTEELSARKWSAIPERTSAPPDRPPAPSEDRNQLPRIEASSPLVRPPSPRERPARERPVTPVSGREPDGRSVQEEIRPRISPPTSPPGRPPGGTEEGTVPAASRPSNLDVGPVDVGGAPEPPGSPQVRISIGRLIVRAPPERGGGRERGPVGPRKPAMGLGDYLAARRKERA